MTPAVLGAIRLIIRLRPSPASPPAASGYMHCFTSCLQPACCKCAVSCSIRTQLIHRSLGSCDEYGRPELGAIALQYPSIHLPEVEGRFIEEQGWIDLTIRIDII